MIYWIWVVFKRMGPFKVVTLDDMWDQMNRGFMYPVIITFAYMIDFSTIAGAAIKCFGFNENLSPAFVDNYCWTQGIYTIVEAYDLENTHIPYPGIIPEEVPACIPVERYDGVRIECPKSHEIVPPTRVYHLWYPYVQLYFWLLSVIFYMPYMVSIFLGFGYVKPIIKMLHEVIPDEEEFDEQLDKAARSLRLRFDTFMDNKSLYNILYSRNTMLFIIFFTKLQYLFFSVTTLVFTHRMFTIGNFYMYGFDWVSAMMPGFSPNLTLPQDKLFPKMAACEIKRWGTTGIEISKGMCVLPQNVSNSYLYLVFWIFLMLTILGNVIGILVTLAQYFCKPIGYQKLVYKSFWNDVNIRRFYWNIGSSGRVILHQLAENMHPCTFEKLIKRYWWLKKHEKVQYNGHLKID